MVVNIQKEKNQDVAITSNEPSNSANRNVKRSRCRFCLSANGNIPSKKCKFSQNGSNNLVGIFFQHDFREFRYDSWFLVQRDKLSRVCIFVFVHGVVCLTLTFEYGQVFSMSYDVTLRALKYKKHKHNDF